MKIKKLFIRILSFVLVTTSLFILMPQSAYAKNEDKKVENKDEKGTDIEAKSALLIEPVTGKVLYEKTAMKNLHLHQLQK